MPILLVVLLSGCDFFKFKSEDDEDQDNPVLASVDNTLLKHSDVGFITKDIESEIDSANLVERYIQSWIRKQLMIREAGKNMSFNEAELNRKLLDYRYALMVHEFEKSYVEEYLDKNIPESEILDYYQKNQDNFTLKEVIVRTNFYKLEKELPQKRQIDRLFRSNNEKDQIELKDFASRYATNYFLEDSTWIKFDDIKLNTPLVENPNSVQLLRQNKLIQVDDDRYAYYFRILEYKLQNQVPPLEFVKDEISKILINKRRVALAEKLHKEVYNRALGKNEFKIYE